MPRSLLYCLLLFLFLLPASGLSAAVTIDGDTEFLSLGKYIDYVEDRDGSMTLAAVRAKSAASWTDSATNTPSFGYTNSAYWLRFELDKTDPGEMRFLLEIAYPVLDSIEVFVLREGELTEHYRLGDSQPFSSRVIDHPNFLVPIPIGTSTELQVYLRVQSSSSVQIPVNLWRADRLVEHNYAAATGNALFYGAMLIMAIYNLLIFITVRDISYFYYVMYVLSMALLMAGIQGLSFQFLWPEAVGWNDVSMVVALSGMVFFPCFFTRSFLAIPRTRPLLSKCLFGLGLLAVATMVSGFFLPYRTAMVATMLLSIVTILANYTSGILRWLDGYHAARYYNFAWTFMLTGGLILAFNKLGMIPRNWFTEHAAQLGAGTEIMLLSFALANRMTHDRRLREQAQKESADAQQQLLANQIRANQDLDRIVRQRTEELERSNAKLQEMSSTDGLTGLQNRRFFDELLQNEYRRAYRDKTPIALVMIDLDHFKSFNDTHGHQFGDLCLIKVGKMIKDNIRRPPDTAARYGGEEFVILLPNTDTAGALCVARNMLDILAATTISDGTICQQVTASIGVASHIPDDGTTPHGLLKEADINLYAAKANGRNRVEWQSPATPDLADTAP
ncbi:MAG: hypothetical protein CL583_18395 [Alteromonadaceae bacterium]|nr:hypothetical protein [Alteromonadaceae bacterium]|tara:strand:+ start:522 stop:2375 length:1854 start_codon:yes stop_codon:yes gene_type:complete